MSDHRTRHRITSVEELDEGDRVIADINGREIAVFAYDGDYHALANHCIHQAGPLCEGALQGTQEFSITDEDWEWRYDDDPRVIVCPWHAWRFEITTGKNVDDDQYAVPSYDVEVENGDVYVLM
jgi:nitrite reductase/ring-hydroxylating ferredoxin subunit